jgi:transcriptional regulator with XRE-family HTH domain
VQLNQAVKRSINAEMTRQGISQRELARKLRLSQQYIWRRLSDNERADMEFTPSELEAVAAALGVPVAQLLPTTTPAGGAA